MTRTRALISLCAAVLAAGLGACVQSLDDGSVVPLMSLREEEEVGRLQHPRMLAAFGGAYNDRELDRYVGIVTVRLIEGAGSPNAVRTVSVLNSPSVNAFALPGGYIYVTRGLLALANDEAELATVVAHEVGHVEARHPAKRIARLASAEVLDSVFGRIFGGEQAERVASLGSDGYIAQYSRLQELEADELGIKVATAAGYDPSAALAFMRSMERDQELQAQLMRNSGRSGGDDSYMTAHPPTRERIEHARAVVAGLTQGGDRGRSDYLDHIDGMIYGDAPQHGILRDRTFFQPDLGFTFTMPAGYVIHNRPNAVVAIGEGKKLILFDAAELSTATSLIEFVEQSWAAALAIKSVEEISVNGLKAVTAYAPLGHRDVRLVAIRYGKDRIYRFIALGAPGTLAEFDGEVAELVNSFRTLSPAEARNVRPLHIKIHTVRPGDTVQSLAGTMPFATHRLERFLVINNIEPGAALVPGQRVKLIAG